MDVINKGMRKGIKVMCVTAQKLQFFSLIPKPKDFVTRIVGDVVYLSARIQKLSDDMTRLLDNYTDIPTNYLMTQMNSITGSLTGITNRLNTYTQNGVNQVIGLGENTTSMITELTGGVIDLTGSVTNAVVGLGSAIAETSSNILGQTDTAEDIHDATEVILEWTTNGFKVVRDNATDPIKKVTQKLTDTRTGINDKIQSRANAVDDKIESAQKWVETLITELREKMEKLSNTIDTGFKDVTGLSSVSRGATTIAEGLSQLDNSPAAQATTAVSASLATVIKNFSIGKMVTAFAGVLTQSALVRTGLDKLPPIDFESMMCKIRDDVTMNTKELYKHYNKLTDSAYKDLIEFGEEASRIPSEDRDYSSKNYDAFVSEFDEEIKKKRDEIRILMKNASVNDRGENSINAEVNKEIRSAIKEIEKYRKKIKNARQTDTLKTVIGNELDNFKKEAEYRCNSIKSDWQSMMNQYSKAISEIKEFFSNGGSCDMFINDCCDRINKDFDEIKALCKNLGVQLVNSSIKVVMPADIGTVVPNPVYKIAEFIMDIKIILKFIKDLITLVIDIINHINKIARIMLNGLNDLKEIIQQLMEMIGLKWLMNLIQNIITLFGDNINSAKISLENTLSPVHFSDTEQYNNTLDALDELLEENAKITQEQKDTLGSVVDMLTSLNKTAGDKDIKKLISNINTVKGGNLDSDNIDKIIDELENQGEFVVAYKSPIIKENKPEDNASVSDLTEGGDIENDIKFVGWHFFHPNLDHTNNDYYGSGVIGKLMKKIKSKIIKKASKTGSKRRGGINGMKSIQQGGYGRWKVKKIAKNEYGSAYTAFYWYTFYTEDLEKDCFEFVYDSENDVFGNQDRIYVDNIVKTENGSIVELTDGRKVFVANNNVRSGDYVNVNGVKYRVK